jgi:hypothetical protein
MAPPQKSGLVRSVSAQTSFIHPGNVFCLIIMRWIIMCTLKKWPFMALCFFLVAMLGGICLPCPPASASSAYEVESSTTKCCSEFLCPCPEYLDNAALPKGETTKVTATADRLCVPLIIAPTFGSTLPHSAQQTRFALPPIYLWTQSFLI